MIFNLFLNIKYNIIILLLYIILLLFTKCNCCSMGGHVCVFAVPTGSDKVVGSQGRGGGQVPGFR